MNNRVPAIISTISSSFSDFTLDYIINKYNIYKVLFWITFGSFIIHIFYALLVGIEFNNNSVIYIVINSISLLLGYIFYIEALTKLPIALVGLIESGSLFIYLIIDILNGCLKVNLWFIFLFILFISSIILFSYDSYKYKDKVKTKNIKLVGVFFILASIFFYGLEPYLVKAASLKGTSGVCINIAYYILAVPFFFYMYIKNKHINKNNNKNIIFFIIIMALLEAINYAYGTMGYIREIAVINAIINELNVFILFILSIIFKTDILTKNKVIAVIIGFISVIGIYFY